MLNVDAGGVKGNDNGVGWKMLDIRKVAEYVHDFNSGTPFPFKNEGVDNFYCSHTLEHVKPHLLRFVLHEFYRCLSNQGLLRVVVPDAELAIKWYLTEPDLLKAKGLPAKPDFYPDTKMGWLMSWFYTYHTGKKTDGHSMGFDYELLIWYLRAAGFRRMDRLSYNNHAAVFEGKDRKRYRKYSLYVEARR